MKAQHLAPVAPAAPRKRRLGEILLDAGLLTEPQLLAALAEQRKWGGKLGHTLVQLGYVNEGAMAHALSHQLDLPTVDLDEFEPPGPVEALLRVELAERYGVFPISYDPQQALTVATSDPTNSDGLQELGLQLGRQIRVVVSSASAIERAIQLHYHGEFLMAPQKAAPSSVAMGFRSAPEPVAPPSPPVSPRMAMSSARENELLQRVDALSQQVEDLQRMVASQARAMHGLMELLEGRGVVSRAEYLAKLRGS